jgi:inward rectifier potassium channel
MATTREPTDLGFGSVVSAESRVRLMNRDGSFNVERGSRLRSTLMSPYHLLLTMGWGSFLTMLVVAYLASNVLFATLFLLVGGPQGIGMSDGHAMGTPFVEAFFLSVQTFGTIGFGEIYPATVPANWVVSLESLVSLLGVALATGLIFARFSRPIARIRFSRTAVVAPYQSLTAFMFRIVNSRVSEIVGLEATVIYARFEIIDGVRTRVFTELPLERKRVVFFSLAWTIVHPIDEASPLYRRTEADLHASEGELLILLRGTHDTFSQTVYSRSSYVAREITWGRRFVNLFLPPTGDGIVRIDLSLLDATEPVQMPAPPAPATPDGQTETLPVMV